MATPMLRFAPAESPAKMDTNTKNLFTVLQHLHDIKYIFSEVPQFLPEVYFYVVNNEPKEDFPCV
jgi:hypothetical protein